MILPKFAVRTAYMKQTASLRKAKKRRHPCFKRKNLLFCAGSTLGIQTMLALVKQEENRISAGDTAIGVWFPLRCCSGLRLIG